MNNRVRTPLLKKLLFLLVPGFVFILTGFDTSSIFASPDGSSRDIYSKSGKTERFLLVQHGGQGQRCPEMSSDEGCQRGEGDCRGPRHGDRGKHCSKMSHEGGCQGGMGGCSGRKGKGHRGGNGKRNASWGWANWTGTMPTTQNNC